MLTSLLLAPAVFAAQPFGINGTVEWVDLIKSASWGNVGSITATQDSQGWPTSDVQWVVLDERRNMPWSGPDPDGVNSDIAGTYKLSFIGQATITGSGDFAGTVSIQNQVYNSGSNTTTADLVVQPNNWLVVVQFTNTKRTSGSSFNTGFTNMHCWRAGYPAGTTQVFTNECLNSYGPAFTTNRTMGLSGTNDYFSWSGSNLINSQWADRPKVSDAYQGGTPTENDTTSPGHQGHGIAWEYLVMLCNQTNKDIWLNVPISATDDYVTKLAQLLKYGSDGVTPYTSTQANPVYPPLGATQHVYLEYANEVWNFSFNESIWNQVKAQADGISNQQEYVKREYQIVNDFKAVYGAPAINTTIRPTVHWQYGQWGPIRDALVWLETTYGIKINSTFYAIGEAPYYGPNDDSTINNYFNTAWTNSDGTRSDFIGWRAVAAFFGIHETGYESGPNFNTATSMYAERDPRITTSIVHHFVDNWFAVGGDMVNYFAGGFGGFGPCGGTWTQGEDWNNQHSPKMDGIIQEIQSAQPAITAGNVLPWASGQSIAITTDQPDQSWGVTPNAFGSASLLRAGSSGTFNISLTGHVANANIQMQIWVDDALLGTVSYPGNNGTSATVATGTLAAGFHGVSIKYVYINGQTTGSGTCQKINITWASGGGTALIPSAPSGVSVTAGNSQATLSWAPTATATSYNVKRSTASGSGYVNVASSALTSYVNTGLTNGTTYYYTVTAVSATGESALSPQVSAVPVPGIAAAPTGVNASANATAGGICGNGNGIASISWTVSPNATAYNIKRGTINGSGYSTVKTQFNNSYQEAGLSVATTYYYVVSAVNSAGESANSSQVSITTTASILATPTGLTAIPTNNGIQLKWTPPALESPSFSAEYNVKRGTVNGGPYTQIAYLSTDNLLDRSALNGTTYYYVVSTVNTAGESSNSSQASAAATANGTIAINCFGSATGNFVADTDFNAPGGGGTTTSAIDTSLVLNPAPQAVYQSRRTGANGVNLIYTIPGLIANAPYNVKLHFCETNTAIAVGGRVFNVLINGGQVLSNYDVVRRAGAVNKAVVEKLHAIANSSGQIVITFAYGPANNPMISGIEVY